LFDWIRELLELASLNRILSSFVPFFGSLSNNMNPVLWIDTVSVPIQQQYKTVAIKKLRSVYQKASSVLLVDKCLMQVGKDHLERQIQLLCSEWGRRLWTLQEGRLASKLYVQFKDEAVAVDELWKKSPLGEPMAKGIC
jgi:hypothetical protein